MIWLGDIPWAESASKGKQGELLTSFPKGKGGNNPNINLIQAGDIVLSLLLSLLSLPVVPHKAVAEVSRIGNV